MLILEKAIATELPRVADDYEQDGVRVLVAFCRELQRASADAPFYLSCRTASGILGVDHNTRARHCFYAAHGTRAEESSSMGVGASFEGDFRPGKRR